MRAKEKKGQGRESERRRFSKEEKKRSESCGKKMEKVLKQTL